VIWGKLNTEPVICDLWRYMEGRKHRWVLGERERQRAKEERDMWTELIKHTNSVSILKHSCVVGHIFS